MFMGGYDLDFDPWPYGHESFALGSKNQLPMSWWFGLVKPAQGHLGLPKPMQRIVFFFFLGAGNEGTTQKQ